MKFFVATFALASAFEEGSAAWRQWNDLEDRRAAFGQKLTEMDMARFADRFDGFVAKGVSKIPLHKTDVEGCVNIWGIDTEESDDFNPETATACEYARKIGRSYLRWTQKFLCLDSFERKGVSIKKRITNRFNRVISFSRAQDFCNE